MQRPSSLVLGFGLLLLIGSVAESAKAQSCFGIKPADLSLSQRTIANACARDADDCYGEARRWQNISRYLNNNVCPGTDRAELAQHNAMVRRIVASLGRDRGRVGRYNEAVRDYNRPRGYATSPPPAPSYNSNPNPFNLYGNQPAYAPCTRYTLNVDGSKNCF